MIDEFICKEFRRNKFRNNIIAESIRFGSDGDFIKFLAFSLRVWKVNKHTAAAAAARRSGLINTCVSVLREKPPELDPLTQNDQLLKCLFVAFHIVKQSMFTFN